MDKEAKLKGIRICEDCRKDLLDSGPIGIMNYSILESSGKVAIVPKAECQRCKARKERK